MCGIVGMISSDPLGRKRELITAMASTLGHRGPDSWGRYVSRSVALGQTRLSIIDLTSGDQPMQTERSAITYNGEVFNYIELRDELESLGHSFATGSDTEVVMQAIEEWGTEAIKRFNGQYAILYWDKRKRELLAIRDRYGMLPLFYSMVQGSVYFASEMKAFDVIPGIGRTWDPESLLTHGLFWNTLDESTVYKNIQSLAPGSYTVFSSEGKKIRSDYYYRLGEIQPPVPSDYGEALNEFRSRLQHAVDLRLRSDVPVGCYLSGGIDSSVTSLLARERMGDRFQTFSVSFSESAYDETPYQQMMVNHLGSEHVCENITPDTINENFLEAAWHFERPVFRTAPLPLFMLSKRVRKEGIRVVLTGEGADEVLCGYDVFKEIKLIEEWNRGASQQHVSEVIGKLYPHLAHYKDDSQIGFLRMYYEGFLNKIQSPAAGLAIRFHNNRILEKYLNPEWNATIDENKIDAALMAMTPDYIKEWPILKREQFLEMRTLMEGYLLSSQGDRMSLGHGIEGRYPFLDHEFVDWVFNLPMDWKLRGYQQKAILRDAYRDRLPAPIIDRPKQPYQAPDLISFLRNGVPTGCAETFLAPSCVKEYGIFNPKMIQRFLFKYQRRGNEGIGYRDNMLMTFILSAQMAEYWIRNPKKNLVCESACTVDVEEP